MPGCNTKQDKNNGISLHRFPRDPEMREKWIIAIKREDKISSFSVVCSLHFRPKDFEPIGQRGQKLRHIFLKRNAVPSIFSFSDVTTLMNALEEQKNQMTQG